MIIKNFKILFFFVALLRVEETTQTWTNWLHLVPRKNLVAKGITVFVTKITAEGFVEGHAEGFAEVSVED